MLTSILLAIGPTDPVYEAWQLALQHGLRGHRPEFISDLSHLRLLPFVLGGPGQIPEVLDAIDDAGRWWP